MKFLVDANLPPGLATWLCEHAHGSIHVSDQLGLTLDDRAVFEFARRNDYIILTKDEDFATLATLVDGPASVVWLRLGNATNTALRNWLEPLLPDILQDLTHSQRFLCLNDPKGAARKWFLPPTSVQSQKLVSCEFVSDRHSVINFQIQLLPF